MGSDRNDFALSLAIENMAHSLRSISLEFNILNTTMARTAKAVEALVAASQVEVDDE